MVLAVGYTHKGKRKNNEDSFLISDNFAVVADGMGGHSKGEVASSMAVEYIGNCLKQAAEIDENTISKAVISANKAIFERASASKVMQDMGTTVVLCCWKDGKVTVANVGDSRCYLCSKGKIDQITTDHSYVQSLVDSGEITAAEAERRSDKNIILRAVGCEENVEVDIFKLSARSGDKILLCSDGLSGVVADNELNKILLENSGAENVAQLLVDRANADGADDNITAVVVEFK